ncbi:MAG: hypothetical protein KF745_07050 [Phycisphaeraceae bacterium]|nr:hypothetical protein [Phycisphaeraceae bacterium]
MMKKRMRWVGALAVVSVLATGAAAQWSSDSSTNLAITNISGDSVQPKVRSTSDGGCWVSFYDNRGSGYGMYIQRLDCRGNPQLGADGMLVAAGGQSSTQDYGLAVDGAGNAYLAYRDDRSGSVQVSVNKVTPSGSMPWGVDGSVTVSTTSGGNNPKVACTSDGSVVVGWSLGAGFRMQRLDGAGATQWVSDGIASAPAVGSYAVSELVGSDNGAVIALWIRYVGNFLSNKHLYTQKYDAAGAPLWNSGNPVIVFDANSVQNGYFPTFVSDGAGGAVYGWYETGGTRNAYVQRVSAAGVEVFPHGGVAGSTTANYKLSASIAYHGGTGETFLFWTESNTVQSQWGLSGQKISAGGARLWTDSGVEFLPLSTMQNSFVKVVNSVNGAMVYYFDQPGASAAVRGFKVDTLGNPNWLVSPLGVGTGSGSKGRLDASSRPDGTGLVVWHDNRTGNNDVYAQRVNIEGTLGNPPPPVPTEIAVFVNLWANSVANGTLGGDYDKNGVVEPADIAAFVSAWFSRLTTGC